MYIHMYVYIYIYIHERERYIHMIACVQLCMLCIYIYICIYLERERDRHRYRYVYVVIIISMITNNGGAPRSLCRGRSLCSLGPERFATSRGGDRIYCTISSCVTNALTRARISSYSEGGMIRLETLIELISSIRCFSS